MVNVMISKKVSVIVPAYNSEKYISKCIKSILNQTYKNLQIILINDGSTDNTLKIFNDFAAKDRRICVFSNKNQGIAATRNFGLQKAKGEYIVFIDSDDYVASNAIELLVNSIMEEKSDMVICNSMLIDTYGHPKERDSRNYKKKFLHSNVWNEETFWDHLYNGFWGECTVPWGKLYKTKIFDKLRYPNGRTNEDDFILYNLIHRCNKISVIDDILYYHMDRVDSITNNNNNGIGEKFLDGVEVVLIRSEKALINNQDYLVRYSLNAVPTLMVIQFQCRKVRKYRELKKLYRDVFMKAKQKKVLSKREKLSFACFYYFQGVYNCIYKVYRKL